MLIPFPPPGGIKEPYIHREANEVKDMPFCLVLPLCPQVWLSISLSGHSKFEYDTRGATNISFGVAIAAIGLIASVSVEMVAPSERGPEATGAQNLNLNAAPSLVRGDTYPLAASGSGVYMAAPERSRGSHDLGAKSAFKTFQARLRWVLPHALPCSAVAVTVIFSQW